MPASTSKRTPGNIVCTASSIALPTSALTSSAVSLAHSTIPDKVVVWFPGVDQDPFVAVGVGKRELCIEGIAALPESTNSMLAPVVNFLILNRGQTVRVGRRSGFFVASGCCVFHAVKVAQRGTEDEVESPKKPVFIKVFQGARVAELVDAPDLGSGSLGSEGSTPFARTIFNRLPVSNPFVSTTATECK